MINHFEGIFPQRVLGKSLVLSTSINQLTLIALFCQISRNITTNEMANVMRYSYLRGPGGRFWNPYDRGCRKNCSDFLINGYNEDIEYNEESSQPDGIRMMDIGRSSTIQNGEASSPRVNGNGHVSINISSSDTKSSHHHHHHHHGHTRCSSCSHGKPKPENLPLGLGLGLGRSGARSVAAS